MRNLYIPLIFLAAGLLMAASCKKGKYHTVVSGTVVNGAKVPLENALVIIRDGIASGGGWVDIGGGNTSSGLTSSAYTDKDGRFKIELTGEHFAYVGVRKEGYEYIYSQGGSAIGAKPYPGGVFENEVFEMTAPAYFAPVLVSTRPVDSRDTVSVYSRKNGSDRECIGKQVCSISVEMSAVGDKFFKYDLYYKRNGIRYTKLDSVYIKSFETYRDTIYY